MNGKKFTADESVDYNEPVCEDSTEELLKKYDRRRTQKNDDIPAMQAVVCVILAALLLLSNLFYPKLCTPVYERLLRLTSETEDVMPNPIDIIMEKL
ncbi:MAG: hypothetical protein IJX77_05560 [Ruminococcus sp.]|nr:hypothetical protein [Ruminococcus sp.]